MPILYVAGVSLCNNPKDISPKSVAVFNECDFLIGEERKNVHRMLSTLTDSDKEYYLLNEHSSDIDRRDVLARLLECDSAVLFTDAGTPAISDPDSKFIAMCHASGVEVRSLAGASSITTALSVSGVDCRSFFFAGFPPRESPQRDKFFKSLENVEHTTVFMERPYALSSTLKSLSSLKRKIAISINLAYPTEINDYDYPASLLSKYDGMKAPFIIIIPTK